MNIKIKFIFGSISLICSSCLLYGEQMILNRISLENQFSNNFNLQALNSGLDLRLRLDRFFVHTDLQWQQLTTISQNQGYWQQSLWFDIGNSIYLGASHFSEQGDLQQNRHTTFDLFWGDRKLAFGLRLANLESWEFKVFLDDFFYQDIRFEIENLSLDPRNWKIYSQFKFWQSLGPTLGYENLQQAISIGLWFKKDNLSASVHQSFDAASISVSSVKISYSWGKTGRSREDFVSEEQRIDKIAADLIYVPAEKTKSKPSFQSAKSYANKERKIFIPSLSKLLAWRLSAREALLFTQNGSYCGLSSASIAILKNKKIGVACEKK